MAHIRRFVAFEVFLITYSLWTALDRTICARYLARPTGEAGVFWSVSLLLVIVFLGGLPFVIREARQSQATRHLTPSHPSTGALLISAFFFMVAEALRSPQFLAHVSAPPVPTTVRGLFILLTAVHIGAYLLWAGSLLDDWRQGRRFHAGLPLAVAALCMIPIIPTRVVPPAPASDKFLKLSVGTNFYSPRKS